MEESTYTKMCPHGTPCPPSPRYEQVSLASANQINPPYIWGFFVKKNMPYNLLTKVLRRLPQAQANRYGLNSLSFRGHLLGNTLKDEIKRAGILTKFLKKLIAKGNGEPCRCLICKEVFLCLFTLCFFTLF